jgi:hypothetical protein
VIALFNTSWITFQPYHGEQVKLWWDDNDDDVPVQYAEIDIYYS